MSKSPQLTAMARTSGPTIPVWSGPLVVIAGLIIGLIVAVLLGSVGLAHSIVFALGALAAVALVQPRGLYLTVAAIPVGYGIFSFLAGWAVSASNSLSGAFSPTTILTGAYPLIEHFPALIITTVTAALVAVVRLHFARRTAHVNQDREVSTRRLAAASDRRNRETTRRARERSSALTVAEIAARRGTNSSTGRIGERDREARRREQAAERAARERIEAGLPARDALEREQAERVARAREAREAREAAIAAEAAAVAKAKEAARAQAEAAAPTTRPDPAQRAGSSAKVFPISHPEAVESQAVAASEEPKQPESMKKPSALDSYFERKGLNDDLYDGA